MIAGVTITVVDLAAAQPDDWQLLSDDERARAERFTYDEHRGRYVVGRAAVRRTLGQAVGAAPAALDFAYSDNGRPDLAGHPEISFNFTNSAAVGVIAVSTAGRVGVDVEVSRPDFADLRVAARFFAPGEVRRLTALPAADRDLAFLRCWTRKEALLKAVGAGLTSPLREFEVSFEPGAPPRLLDPGQILRGGGWELADISDLVPGCVAAVALDRRRD